MKNIFLVISFCFFLSCATSKNTIESNKDPLYINKINKVFIAAYKVENTKGVIRKVSYAIQNSLDSVYVDSKLYFLESDDLALSLQVPEEEIRSYLPDVIMTIRLKSGEYNFYGATRFNLDIVIIDPAYQKIVWRADVSSKLHSQFGFEGLEHEKTMKKLADSIIEKLVEDELLKQE